MTANATHPGRITIPGTDIGVGGSLIAEPQTENMLLGLDDRLAGGPVKVETDPTGNLYSPGLVVPIVSGVLWRLRFEPYDSVRWPPFELGIYNLNTSGQALEDLVLVTPTAFDATYSPTDAAVAAAVGSGAATRAALTRTGKRAVGQDELVLNAADYGLVGDTTVQDMTSLNAAITSAAALGGVLGGSVTVYFPHNSGAYYNLQQAFPNVSNVTIRGDGMTTILRWTAGNMLAPTTALSNWSFEDIGIENLAPAGHLIDLGTTGGLVHSTFRRCEIKPRNINSSIMYMNGNGNTFNIRFWDCKLWRQPTHTVPAIDLRSGNAGCSAISFYGGQWHGQNNNLAPFARFETLGASNFIGGLTFRDVLGEQNLGGMVHCYGCSRVTIDNVMDYDGLTNPYTDDLFKFDAAASGPQCYGVIVENSGTTGTCVQASGKVHLRITGGNYHRVGRLHNGGTPTGTSALPSSGLVMMQGGGPAWGLATRTANYTVLISDYYLLGNGVNITFTLPDPTALVQGGTLPAGREFTFKNIHSTPLTVVSAGTATIDGATSKVLATNDVLRFTTDGTNWFVVGGGPRLAVQSTASTATLTVNADAYTRAKITAQAAALNIANPTGTPAAMQSLIIRVKDNGTARAITYGTQFRAVGVTLPTTTAVNKTVYLGCIWNAEDTKWDVIAVAAEA